MSNQKKNNILILSVGRRVELIDCFRDAAKELNLRCSIFGADCDSSAPGAYLSDKFIQLPRIDDTSYIDSIVKAGIEYKIDLIIPTIDTDLLLLSQNIEYIEDNTNAKLMISSYDTVKICRDKVLTHKFLEDNNFLVPRLYNKREVVEGITEFPLFIKPKNGSSSIDAYKINSYQELQKHLNLIQDPMIQDFMDGPEYTVDVFSDFNGKIISVTPRLRIATRSGEISKGKIVNNEKVIKSVYKLITALKTIGHVTVQVIETKRGVEFIEVNPRFGGGAPMSIKSGSNSCKYLMQILRGEELEYRKEFKENLTFLRFDRSIAIDENGMIVDV